MTLIEAIKTGKRIRRKGWEQWHLDQDMTLNKLSTLVAISRDDILAEDWEVEPTPITITREQFDAAWRKSCRETAGPGYDLDDIYQILVKELGL